MPPIKKQPLCEIIFGQLRIPVSDKERGKQAIEGIFMIGEPGKAEAELRVGKRGRRKVKRVKVVARRRKIRAASEGKAAGFGAGQIRSLRKKIGLSQKELADLVGVSRATVSMWEGGKFEPKEEKVRQLASLAGKSKEEIQKMLGGKMPQKPQGKKLRKPRQSRPKTRRQRKGQAQAVNAQKVNAQVVS
jgi:transcriptional regulator with XRE-family HTH domain